MKNFIWIFLIFFFSLSTAIAQVGIGTTTPDASAMLDVESTEKGFLPPRMTTSERDDINNPAEGLTIFNSEENCVQFFNGTGWFNLCDGTTSSQTPLITGGACDGEPEVLTFNDLEYRPVEGADNKCWLDRNLGASQVAASSTDEDSYGDLYQWGRATDGHEDRNSSDYNDEITGIGVSNFDSPGGAWDGQFILRDSAGVNNWVNPSVTGVDDLWQGVNGTNNPCPPDYRVPTEAEWTTEQNSWSPNSGPDGAIASPLKLPLAGARARQTGDIVEGGDGNYWTSTISGDDARLLFFILTFSGVSPLPRAEGGSVRCIKD